MIARMKTLLVLLGCGVFLAACGGDGNSPRRLHLGLRPL